MRILMPTAATDRGKRLEVEAGRSGTITLNRLFGRRFSNMNIDRIVWYTTRPTITTITQQVL